MSFYTFDGVMEMIAQRLEERLSCVSMRFKSYNGTEEVYKESVPIVYRWTFDDDDINEDGFPVKLPAVLVQFVNVSDNTISVLIYICCYNGFIDNREIFNDTGGGLYERQESQTKTGPDVLETTYSSRRGLYLSTIRLGEYVFNSVHQMSNDGFPITGVEMTPPTTYLDEFPYCTCSISFDVEMGRSQFVQNTKLHSLL